VDVRGRAEWDALRIAGAVHIPLGDVARRSAELPEGPLVCLCETGSRSAVAASVLRALGRTEVANLAGGIIAWRNAGLPLER
jgi:rhodanese-related sulfurtransferase